MNFANPAMAAKNIQPNY